MLYERVRQLCFANGITITQLERTLNFGNGTIHNWSKSTPAIDKVEKIAKYFGLSIDELYKTDGIPSKESRELAYKLDCFTEEQKNLVRCYLSLIESGKAG